MIHYYLELSLWMAALFLAGCPLGVLARRAFLGRREPVPGPSPEA